jgi:hypothetical protein
MAHKLSQLHTIDPLYDFSTNLKGVSHEILRVLFWIVWIDIGLYKNLWLFLFFSVEPVILYLHLKFRSG